MQRIFSKSSFLTNFFIQNISKKAIFKPILDNLENFDIDDENCIFEKSFPLRTDNKGRGRFYVTDLEFSECQKWCAK